MRPALAGLIVCCVTALAACAPRLIPGTAIKDTSDNRQILDLVGDYKSALEAKDIDGILKMVSQSFFEHSGNTEEREDFDYAGLQQKLRQWAAKTKSVRAAIEVKDIVIEGDNARVRYFYDISFQVPGPNNTFQWKRETDTKEMALKRESKSWLITSGI